MAYSCNLGPETMARLTHDVTDADIRPIADWYLHEDALRAALVDIVNAIAALDTTQGWGDGRASSSDGQRFLFPRRVLRRTYSHRLGDYAVECYTSIANNYAPFYTVPIECTERDARSFFDLLQVIADRLSLLKRLDVFAQLLEFIARWLGHADVGRQRARA